MSKEKNNKNTAFIKSFIVQFNKLKYLKFVCYDNIIKLC